MAIFTDNKIRLCVVLAVAVNVVNVNAWRQFLPQCLFGKPDVFVHVLTGLVDVRTSRHLKFVHNDS
jgi:hypothetical protein